MLALPDVVDARDAEPTERSEDRLALRVQDLWLHDDDYDNPGHGGAPLLWSADSLASRVAVRAHQAHQHEVDVLATRPDVLVLAVNSLRSSLAGSLDAHSPSRQ